MYYIVFDLEFNQDFSSTQKSKGKSQFPFEIIQIGALKLDSNFNTIATFNRLIKPSIYDNVSAFVTELTGITTELLQEEEPFHDIYKAYLEFIGATDSIFCIWGMSDIRELYKNVEYHQLNQKPLPNLFINLQPFVSLYFGLPPKNLLRLQHAVEALQVSMNYPFHNAFYDAYYTAEIFKKIYNPYIQPIRYDPSNIKPTIRPRKKVVDIDKLLKQFDKMYERTMTDEEKEIILLAYRMGKTDQFIK